MDTHVLLQGIERQDLGGASGKKEPLVSLLGIYILLIIKKYAQTNVETLKNSIWSTFNM
jgi:hypothetical protein